MKYDYSKVSREALVDLAKAAERFDTAPGVYRLAIELVQLQAQVKTRAEYDREIGDFMRFHLKDCIVGAISFSTETGSHLRILVNASRNAPEE